MMLTLCEIINKLQANERVENEDLGYAVLALTGILNLVNFELADVLINPPTELKRKLMIENGKVTFYGKALIKPPKEWLGWNNDPKNPDYQSFHKMGLKIVDKFTKGKVT